MNNALKFIVALVIVAVAWKFGGPWVKEHLGTPASTSKSSDNSCVAAAESASERWGSGVTRFSPPYDVAAWESFRSDVDSRIGTAERKCSCSLDSCVKTRQALSEMRSLLNETDSMVRGNSEPPAGLVQRQEEIDATISAARELVLQGK